MPEEVPFPELIRRVRGGDAAAAADLVRQYEPEIRRLIRCRLTDPRLRRTVDSMDICQSVLGNFFVRVAAGQFDLEEPGQLLKVLLTMARNRVLDKVRHEHAARRDQRRQAGHGDSVLGGLAASGDSPSQVVASRELLDAARRLLSDDERRLADLRAGGNDWAEIAAEVGSSPEAVRKKLARAIDRVTAELGLVTAGDP
jgi:RNA polymerase sigma-70 factor (ECF subfamily)